MTAGYEVHYDATQAHPIKSWTRGVPFEDEAFDQVRKLADMPFIHRHVAVMPDVHKGIGSTVGSVIATKGAIIPAAVGVDIGCGMMAQRTSIKGAQLSGNLGDLRAAIERAVPHGRSANGGRGDRGAWGDVPQNVAELAHMMLETGLESIRAKHPKVVHERRWNQLGTLGTGNHFVEVCLDEEDAVWIMLHSGSRGQGNAIGSYFIEKAKREMERWFIHLPDADLAYLPEGSDLFADYCETVAWAQHYARINRELMMRATVLAFERWLPEELQMQLATTETAINCHHNYVERENHFGANVLVTRKGAVRARAGDLGIIPGSMGAKSFIVRGKGNPESFHSCSHGAGRTMSRTEAKKRFTIDDHAKAVAGVECRVDADVIDETPAAYKSIDAVMAAQSDLVEVVHTLKQILCVKG